MHICYTTLRAYNNVLSSPVLDVHGGKFEIDTQLAQEVVVELYATDTSS